MNSLVDFLQGVGLVRHTVYVCPEQYDYVVDILESYNLAENEYIEVHSSDFVKFGWFRYKSKYDNLGQEYKLNNLFLLLDIGLEE